MRSPTWEGADVLGSDTWIPVEPSSADSASLVADRWPHLTLVASAVVRDRRDRPGHVLVAYDSLATHADRRFLAVAMYSDRRERLFEMSHHHAPTLALASAWLREHHGDTRLELSTAILRNAREAAALGRTLTPQALPTPATTEAPIPPRALGR
ncbi:hypothetical protein [Streptomyces sp. SID3343]|uniref:hypothetical protein n=1 Tax=Streptomyces sp. SID3343 TaxID=2690260 RepID=UPI00136EF228|nr:hypothetical protein [Streptomyces sp. SID3343]MYW03382.1 hypothetical protein [Streptomyces sp. SID3343]MYW06212.1 hypothetical protein [Streptomyces sp. SID3343]